MKRKFRVTWKSNKPGLEYGSAFYEAENQTEALMTIMKSLSPDGIHAPECRISVIPWNK